VGILQAIRFAATCRSSSVKGKLSRSSEDMGVGIGAVVWSQPGLFPEAESGVSQRCITGSRGAASNVKSGGVLTTDSSAGANVEFPAMRVVPSSPLPSRIVCYAPLVRGLGPYSSGGPVMSVARLQEPGNAAYSRLWRSRGEEGGEGNAIPADRGDFPAVSDQQEPMRFKGRKRRSCSPVSS